MKESGFIVFDRRDMGIKLIRSGILSDIRRLSIVYPRIRMRFLIIIGCGREGGEGLIEGNEDLT